MKKKLTAIICISAIIITMLVPIFSARAAYTESDLKTAVEDAIKWKGDNDSPLYSIGSNSANLYITALAKLGKSYDYGTYIDGMRGVAAGYGANHTTSDMARSAIAVAAAGGEPQSIGGKDLIADSSFFRDAVAPIDAEGVSGSAWALMALDTKDYDVPDWAMKNRDAIIVNMLSRQHSDGSFDGNVYGTAAAVTALSRYASTSGAYTVTRWETNEQIDISPEDAVYRGLSYLSDSQTKDGDWGDLISTAMAVIAIESSGADASSDSRFVARNGSAIDGLMSYQNRDGGFAQSGNKSNGEATSYAICALTEYLGSKQGKTPVFYTGAGDKVSTSIAPVVTAPTIRATARPAATVRPSSSSSSTARVTAKPTTKPTAKPATTMRPTRTASPASSASPAASSKPSTTPRATRRPDLVGPVQMPGPMRPTDPPQINNGGTTAKKGNTASVIVPVVVGIIILLLLAAIILLKKTGKLSTIFAKKKNNKGYRAKKHRRTEEHRRCEQRERYRKRLKYKHRHEL